MVELNYESRLPALKREPDPVNELIGEMDAPEKEAAVFIANEQNKALKACREILTDKEIQQVLPAVLRTLTNIGIAGADSIPGVGEAVSWGADLVKAAHRIEAHTKTFRKNLLEWLKKDVDEEAGQMMRATLAVLDFADGTVTNIARIAKAADPSPDVKARWAILSEGTELIGLGAVPSHAYEAGHQMIHDVPRIKRGVVRLIGIIRRGLSNEADDFAANEAELTEAMAVFESNQEKA